MEKTAELNKELKEEVNQIFADLHKEIGNNRQQLANKVLDLHKGINKQLNSEKVDAKRKQKILAEVAGIVKMAARQLPHLKTAPVKPTPPAAAPPKRATAARPKK